MAITVLPGSGAFRLGAMPEGLFRLVQETVWCGREDSNFHGLSPTTTSTLRVYQFRHDRIIARTAEPLRG
jgi:hypothetical protein